MKFWIKRARTNREIRFEVKVSFLHGMFHGFEELWETEQHMTVVGPLPGFELGVLLYSTWVGQILAKGEVEALNVVVWQGNTLLYSKISFHFAKILCSLITP
jgi:hypothetical protein